MLQIECGFKTVSPMFNKVWHKCWSIVNIVYRISILVVRILAESDLWDTIPETPSLWYWEVVCVDSYPQSSAIYGDDSQGTLLAWLTAVVYDKWSCCFSNSLILLTFYLTPYFPSGCAVQYRGKCLSVCSSLAHVIFICDRGQIKLSEPCVLTLIQLRDKLIFPLPPRC